MYTKHQTITKPQVYILSTNLFKTKVKLIVQCCLCRGGTTWYIKPLLTIGALDHISYFDFWHPTTTLCLPSHSHDPDPDGGLLHMQLRIHNSHYFYTVS